MGKGKENKSSTHLPGVTQAGVWATGQEVYAGKVPPHSKELEMNVLGAMMTGNSLIDVVTQVIKPGMMYFSANTSVFQVIIELHDKHQPVDTITVSEELKIKGELEVVGGPAYIAELSNAFSSGESVQYSAERILETWVKRQLILETYAINEQCYDATVDSRSLLDNTQRQVMAIGDALYRRRHVTSHELYRTTMEHVELIARGNKDIIGIPSGYVELDVLTSGFQKSELITIAGRPSMGKTAIALNIAMNAAVRYKKPGGIFSIEMSNREIGIRMLAIDCECNITGLKTGKLSEAEYEKIAQRGMAMHNGAVIMIDDSSPLTLMEMKSKARRWKAEFGIEWVMVDYLQLMDLDSQDKRLDRHLQVSLITKGLKQLSKELDIPVIALSQLSRKVEDRGGEKRPQLSDLRESGSIEQDSDVVIFINRPEVYMKKDDPKFLQFHGLAEVIVGKQRNGPVGDVKLTFRAQYAKFENRDKEDEYQMRIEEKASEPGLSGLKEGQDKSKKTQGRQEPVEQGMFGDTPF